MKKKLAALPKPCFLTQGNFAGKINVEFLTANRWEGAKAKPNLSAMRSMQAFCIESNMEYSPLEEAWLDFTVEAKGK